MLLKTISKVIKKLLIRRIRNSAKKHHLLYSSQIKAQAKQGINTALKLLTSII
jgi:ribosomal protein L20